MKSIILIQPYFGKWPLWFDAHLVSIAKNPTVNWLFITDCSIPENYPKNIRFITITLSQFNEDVNVKLNANCTLSARKLCDLRPAFGSLFSEEIKPFDFWGFCDMDIIWGDIRSYMSSEVLRTYEIISSRKESMSGHFSIFKNIDRINELHKKITSYKDCIVQKKLMRCDEELLTEYLKENKQDYKIYWDQILLNQEKGIDSHQEYYLNRWLWKNGKMINTQTKEVVMYLHFINWKRTMRTSEVRYIDKLDQFYVSCTGMHYKCHSKMSVFLNIINNVFDGYWIREKRRRRKQKMTSLIKRVKRKLNIN